MLHMRGSGGGPPTPPPWKSEYIGFFSNTGPDSLENYKATNQACVQCWTIIGPPAKRHLNEKKNVVIVWPTLTKLSGSAHDPSYATCEKASKEMTCVKCTYYRWIHTHFLKCYITWPFSPCYTLNALSTTSFCLNYANCLHEDLFHVLILKFQWLF